MNKVRLDYIDILKGIGILFVIFSHSGAEDWFMSHFGDFFVPLFFIASGYTFGNKDQSFLPFFLKRAKRLLVPYAFFSILLLLLYQRFTSTDLLGVLYSRYCLYPYDSPQNIFLMGGGNPPLWFLTSMLTAFIPFWLLLRFPKYQYWLFGVFVIYTIVCEYLPILLPWSLDTACLTGSLMYAGYLMRRHEAQLFKRPYLGDALLLVSFVVVCYLNGSDNLSVREYGHSFLLYYIICMLGTWFLLRISKRLENTFASGFLMKLGQHSLVIFCIQMFILRICHQVFHSFMHFPTEGWMFYGITFVKILIVAVAGMCVSMLMKRYLPWLLK